MPIEFHPPHQYDPKDGKDAFPIPPQFVEFLGKILIVKLDDDTDKKDGFMVALATITRNDPDKLKLRYYREENKMRVFDTSELALGFYLDNKEIVMEFLDGTYFLSDISRLTKIEATD